MVKLWNSRRLPVQHEIESQQDKLRRLSGQVLERYRRELNAEISDPQRLSAVYGAAFASATVRRQAQLVATMATDMLRVPHAAVSVIEGADKDQQFIAQASRMADLAPETVVLEESFCRHVIGTGRELMVEEAGDHPLVCDTRLAKDGLVTSYLGVPVANRDLVIVGVLCVWDSKSRTWTPADVGMLTQLSMVLTRALPK